MGKNRDFRWLLLVIIMIIFTACDSNDSDDRSDTTPPVIKLNGSATVTINQGEKYVDAGATATDNIDGVVDVTSSGRVDTSTVGTYTITYRAKDRAGNRDSIQRIINVIIPKNSYKLTLKTTKKIAGYEVHLKFKDDTPSSVNIDNSFLGETGRTVNNLGADIDSSTKEIKFGGFTFGDREGVTGEFDILTFQTTDSKSQVSIMQKSCLDKSANNISCDIEIN